MAKNRPAGANHYEKRERCERGGRTAARRWRRVSKGGEGSEWSRDALVPGLEQAQARILMQKAKIGLKMQKNGIL